MSMKPTGAAIAGAIFFLVLFAAAAVGAVLFAVNGLVPAVIPCAAIAAIVAYAIVSSDWPLVWKPLLMGDK